MGSWTEHELDAISQAEEVDVMTVRADGSARRPVPIWVVRVGNDVYVRSYRGSNGAWYRHARADGIGRVRVADLVRDVKFHAVSDRNASDAVDAAYRAKYARYSDNYLTPMVAQAAQTATLRLTPSDN